MPPELAHYTITGAQDWPMFKEMLSGMRILFLLLWGTLSAGGGLAWRDLRKMLSGQRKEDREQCALCKQSRDSAFLEIWDCMDTVAPRNPLIAAAKKRYEEAVHDV